MRALAIDFETANERRDSACAVGLAWIEGGAVVRTAHRLIRPPQMRFNPGNVRVHGIRPADVADAPTFPEAMAEFVDDLRGHVLVAHNAGFDVGVLAASFAAHGRPFPAPRAVCTVRLARRAWPALGRYSLNVVADSLGIRFRHHHAEDDAIACATVALAAAGVLGAPSFAALASRYAVASAAAPRAPRGAADRPPESRPPESRSSEARSSASAAPDALAFTVRGSRGDAYAILASRGPGPIHLRCRCLGWRYQRSCRHTTALLDGEVDALISENAGDVVLLRALVGRYGLHGAAGR